MDIPILVGTDCSGIEAPIEALHQLQVNIKHVFSSEIDKWCLKSIKANYNPEIVYSNMLERIEAPYVDLYICGFPCQPFSIAGKRGGLDDPRGTVIHGCIEYIKKAGCKYFILENVKGLITHEGGKTWKIIQELLKELTSYNISYKILNTKDFGIPQNRERLFIVGSRVKPFEFPEPFPNVCNVRDYIDTEDTHIDPIRNDVILSGMLDKIPKDSVFVDFSFKKHNYPNAGSLCPCIAADSRTWCVPMNRYANISERLALQGFIPKNWKQVVSNTQMKKQIGNSMSVNVLKAILLNLL